MNVLAETRFLIKTVYNKMNEIIYNVKMQISGCSYSAKRKMQKKKKKTILFYLIIQIYIFKKK